jgi:hypothetical protein
MAVLQTHVDPASPAFVGLDLIIDVNGYFDTGAAGQTGPIGPTGDPMDRRDRSG